MKRFWLALTLALVLAAGCKPASDTLVVRVHGAAERPLIASEIRYEPADNVLAAQLSAQGTLAIERRDAARALTVAIPERCPITFAAGPHAAPIDARAVIDLGGDRAPVGFDTPFAIHVKHGCPERGRGRIEWQPLEGIRRSALSISDDGFELRARTPRFEDVHPEPPPAGIVPFSPRTQGRVVLSALWQGPPGSPPIRRIVELRATSRATGLSSVAVSQQLMLGGTDWRVQKAPQSGHAQAHANGALALFTPDAPGRWTLERSDGQTLVVQALWHDKTPYDCGRSECHASIAATTLESPMSAALQRRLEAVRPEHAGCMLECHALGEPGLHDGGFTDVSAQLGFSWLAGTRWDDLPQPLRRLGGVRCTACHGPGVLPEPEGRELVLRSDVCASCHDAPPRYVHVEQWRMSRMARSDEAASTRTSACAGCHTTAGFLERVAERQPRPPLSDAAPTGIACAACHAPHSSHRGARLVRSMPASATDRDAPQPDANSALCLACHAPQPSGALWQGIARIPNASGDGWDVLRAPGPHTELPRGCISCHGATAKGGVDHAFHVQQVSCTPCHASAGLVTPSESQRFTELARVVVDGLEPMCSPAPVEGPAHGAPLRTCSTPRQTRALYAATLVLEDPAAAVHNPTLTRALLDDATQNAR